MAFDMLEAMTLIARDIIWRVAISESVRPAIPTIAFDPPQIDCTVPLNGWSLDTLRVSNVGEPGSVLSLASVSSMIARSDTTAVHASVPIRGDIADVHKTEGTSPI